MLIDRHSHSCCLNGSVGNTQGEALEPHSTLSELSVCTGAPSLKSSHAAFC